MQGMDIHPGKMIGPLVLLSGPPDIHIIYRYIADVYITYIISSRP
jgi:hypothetical protein